MSTILSRQSYIPMLLNKLISFSGLIYLTQQIMKEKRLTYEKLTE